MKRPYLDNSKTLILTCDVLSHMWKNAIEYNVEVITRWMIFTYFKSIKCNDIRSHTLLFDFFFTPLLTSQSDWWLMTSSVIIKYIIIDYNIVFTLLYLVLFSMFIRYSFFSYVNGLIIIGQKLNENLLFHFIHRNVHYGAFVHSSLLSLKSRLGFFWFLGISFQIPSSQSCT